MTSRTSELLTELLSAHRGPCLSLYQRTHRRHPENQQDPIRFRNLVKELDASLRQRYLAAGAQRLLEPFEALAHDGAFWNHTLDGLAVLGGPGIFRVLRLPQSVPELVVVADSFHTKPLWRFLQSVDRYQVLGLSLDKIRFFEGNRHALDEVDLDPGVPRTIGEALGGELTEPHQTVASYGGLGGASNPMRHGHGGKKDEVDIDAQRFFRAIDRAVLEHYSRPSGLPLILAALPEHHRLFHQVSQNPLLVTEGIGSNPDSLSVEELRARAWRAIEPRYQARLASLVEEFELARSKGVGSGDLAQVAQAAASGQVATLLIEADRQIAGRLDGATGRVDRANLSDPQVDDLLDDLGELVVKKGGTVLVIPAERMPTRTGLAATYRWSRADAEDGGAAMHIQINTDSNIEGREKLADHVEGVVESVLSRFSDRITRVEVHLSDENSQKAGQNDKRCMMEARIEGRQPTAVTHEAATLDQAVDGAADKLKRSIESTLERLRDHQ